MAQGTQTDQGVLAQERKRIEKEGTSPSGGVAKLHGRPSASTAAGTPDLEYEAPDGSVDEGEGVLSSKAATLNNELNQDEVAPEEDGILAKQSASIGLKPKSKGKSSKGKSKR